MLAKHYLAELLLGELRGQRCD